MKKKVCLALLLACIFGVFWVVGKVENGSPLSLSLLAIPFLSVAFCCIVFGKLYWEE